MGTGSGSPAWNTAGRRSPTGRRQRQLKFGRPGRAAHRPGAGGGGLAVEAGVAVDADGVVGVQGAVDGVAGDEADAHAGAGGPARPTSSGCTGRWRRRVAVVPALGVERLVVGQVEVVEEAAAAQVGPDGALVTSRTRPVEVHHRDDPLAGPRCGAVVELALVGRAGDVVPAGEGDVGRGRAGWWPSSWSTRRPAGAGTGSRRRPPGRRPGRRSSPGRAGTAARPGWRSRRAATISRREHDRRSARP